MVRSAGGLLRFFVYALIGVYAFFSIQTSFAATTVTDAYDQPSTLTKSVGANHKFTFTTASTISEGATITFTFGTAFTMPTIPLFVEDDLDITDDGVDLTTASTCSGTEQASVSVLSQTITITICAGDGGAIASGSVVVVEMGTNATSSGSGAQQIVNPTSVGTYYVNLAGTFGGSASFPLPIQNDDDDTVSAIVLPSSSSSGGTSGSSGGSTSGGTTSGGADTGGADSGGDTGTTTGDTGGVDGGTTGDGTTTGGTADSGGTTGGSTGDSTGGSTGGSSGGSSSSGGSTSGSGSSGGGSSGSSADDTSTAEDEDVSDDSTLPSVSVDVRVVTDGGIVLSPNGDTFDALAGTETTVQVVVTTDATIEEVRVAIDGMEYVLTPLGEDIFSGTVTFPRADGMIDVIVDTVEAPTTYDTYFVDARGAGLVYENLNNSRTPVNGAVVTVYQIVDGARIPWSGTSNPFLVGPTGSFSFYVPNGIYVVTAGRSGYDDGSSGEIVVSDNILAPSIVLTKIQAPESVVTPPISPPPPSSTTPTTIATTVAAVAESVAAVIATPEVQTAIDIAKPATAVLAVTSAVVLASSFNLLPFLQYLFTAPILFVARRNRKAFGQVYNAATKLPVDLAIIRLFAMPERKLIRSVVTDAQGKYLLIAAPGSYVLQVTKQGFVFPSDLLRDKKDDGTYLDVYTGQEIVVTEKEATISANVPLDPANDAAHRQSPRAVALRRFLRVLQHVIAVTGILLAFVVVVIAPSIFAAVMFVVQIGVYLLARRLTRPKRARGWGIVYDAATRQPVGNAVVRLFEPTYNKLIETAITDRLGRYAFLVGPSEYYVTYSKPGYTDKIVKPIDYRAKTEPTALVLDVPIETRTGDV